MSGNKISVDVARLRAALLQGHDALVVAAQSIERALAGVERLVPEVAESRVPTPVGTQRGDPDDEPVEQRDLSHAATVVGQALAALRTIKPPAPLTFPTSTDQLRALLEMYDPTEGTGR